MAIVVTSYRYRPPPKKPKKLAVTVDVPVIVAAKKKPDHPQAKAPLVVTSISRKRARLLTAAREAERFAEPREVAADAATARAMESIAHKLGLKPPKGT